MPSLLKVKLAIFLTALSTLMIELLLIRVFDVLLRPNMAYMIVTCAMFSFGVAGVYPLHRGAPLLEAGRQTGPR